MVRRRRRRRRPRRSSSTLASERLAQLRRAPAAPLAARPARYRGGEARIGATLEQAHLVLGFAGPAFNDADTIALQVFANLLGGGMSSRLFQEVREKRGLCYAIYSFHWPFADTGLFGVYAGTGEEDVGELMP